MPGGLRLSLRAQHGRELPAARDGRSGTFSLYVRDMPKERGFLVAAGARRLPAGARDVLVRGGGPRLLEPVPVRPPRDPRLRRPRVHGRGGRSPRGDRAREGTDHRGHGADVSRAQLIETITVEPGDAPHHGYDEGRQVRRGGRGTWPRRLRVPTRARGRGGPGGREEQRHGRLPRDVQRRGGAGSSDSDDRDDGALLHHGVNGGRRSGRSPRTTPTDHPPRRHLRHAERRPHRYRRDQGDASAGGAGSPRLGRPGPALARVAPGSSITPDCGRRRSSRAAAWTSTRWPSWSTRGRRSTRSDRHATRRVGRRAVHRRRVQARGVRRAAGAEALAGQSDGPGAQAGVARPVGGRDRVARRGGARPEPRAAPGARDGPGAASTRRPTIERDAGEVPKRPRPRCRRRRPASRTPST